MNGRELASRDARLCPGMPVIFTSGYTDDEILRHGVLTDPSRFIPKPFTRAALAARVREALSD